MLDKHSSAAFSLRDMELLGVFARQAAAAIEAARVGRDAERMMRAALAAIGEGGLDEAGLDALMAQVAGELDRDVVRETLNTFLKTQEDIRVAEEKLDTLTEQATRGAR